MALYKQPIKTQDKHKGRASSGLVDWLRAGGGGLLLPQLAPYLLSSALSWATIWGCTVATWTPPPRPPMPAAPPPAPLRPGCSASVAGGRAWGWGSGRVASRGGSGGWKVGEVSCGCFLFTVLALRGVGSGSLLTVLGRGGEGREFRKANHTVWQSERDRDRDKKETDRERDGARGRQILTSWVKWNQVRKKNPKKDIKLHDSNLFK